MCEFAFSLQPCNIKWTVTFIDFNGIWSADAANTAALVLLLHIHSFISFYWRLLSICCPISFISYLYTFWSMFKFESKKTLSMSNERTTTKLKFHQRTKNFSIFSSLLRLLIMSFDRNESKSRKMFTRAFPRRANMNCEEDESLSAWYFLSGTWNMMNE